MSEDNDIGVGRLNLVTKSVDELLPADYNPRNMNEVARQGLANSINTFGLVQPIIWNEQTGRVVGGHQRLNDIIIKGATETDVVVVDLSEAKEKALNVALNAKSIQGDFDDSMLSEILFDIKDEMAELYEDLNFEEIDIPDFGDLKEHPDNLSEAQESEPPAKLLVIIPQEHAYMADEIEGLIERMIEEHYPDAGISTKQT